MKHAQHNDLLPSHKLFEKGWAVGHSDIVNGGYLFHWYNERYLVTAHIPVQEMKMPPYKFPALVAKIEQVRELADG